MKRHSIGARLACTALLVCSGAALAADGGSDKDKNATDQRFTRQVEPAHNYAADIDAEVKARAVPMPPQMELDIQWYSPHIDAKGAGNIVKGWVIRDMILCETDKHFLIGIRRADGFERWRCELTDEIRYAPSVSENNVVVNVKNYLLGIEKNLGDIRWRLLPDFVMSSTPLVVDPAMYPKEYTKNWQPMESIYAGSWDGKFHSMTVRGRMSYFIRRPIESQNFSAPEFDLFKNWHKTSPGHGSVTQTPWLRDNILYYSGDDRNVYAVSRDAEVREPYGLLDNPSTGLTVTPSTTTLAGSVYVGCENGYVYCLDRLTMKKKWVFPSGYPVTGNIFADEPKYAYAATRDGILHALEISPARSSRGQAETPESFGLAWELPAAGAITTGPDVVYLGLKRTAGYDGFEGIEAVDKSSGKVLWKVDGGGFFKAYLEYQNTPGKADSECRVFAVTNDNRIVSLKERVRNTGVRVFKEEKVVDPSAPVKIIGKKAGGDQGGDAPKPDDAPKN